MSVNLNNVFENILQCEIRAKERKQRLVEVNKQISFVQTKLEEIQGQLSTSQQQRDLKIQKISEEEINLKLNKNRARVLNQQLQEVKNEEINLEKQLMEIQNNNDKIRDEFCAKVKEFSENYFVLGNGFESRKMEMNKKLDDLKAREEEMKTQLELLKQIQQKHFERDKLRDENKQLAMKNEILDSQLNEEKNILEKLKEDKIAVNNKPKEQEEFKRLQMALQECLHQKSKS